MNMFKETNLKTMVLISMAISMTYITQILMLVRSTRTMRATRTTKMLLIIVTQRWPKPITKQRFCMTKIQAKQNICNLVMIYSCSIIRRADCSTLNMQMTRGSTNIELKWIIVIWDT